MQPAYRNWTISKKTDVNIGAIDLQLFFCILTLCASTIQTFVRIHYGKLIILSKWGQRSWIILYIKVYIGLNIKKKALSCVETSWNNVIKACVKSEAKAHRMYPRRFVKLISSVEKTEQMYECIIRYHSCLKLYRRVIKSRTLHTLLFFMILTFIAAN